MAFKLGKDAKLYYKTGGYTGGGSFVELANVKDNDLKMISERADVSTRGNAGFKAEVGAQKTLELSFQMVWDTADTGFTTLRDAFLNNTLLGFKCLDAAAGTGIQFDGMVVEFSRSEPLTEAQMASVVVVPTYSVNPPVAV